METPSKFHGLLYLEAWLLERFKAFACLECVIWLEVLVEDRANITILLVQVSTTLMCIVPRGSHCLGACEAFDNLGAKRAE